MLSTLYLGALARRVLTQHTCFHTRSRYPSYHPYEETLVQRHDLVPLGGVELSLGEGGVTGMVVRSDRGGALKLLRWDSARAIEELAALIAQRRWRMDRGRGEASLLQHLPDISDGIMRPWAFVTS